MKHYVVRRLLQLIPILLIITFLSFGMMRLAGSDAVLQRMENTGMVVSQEVIDAARAELTAPASLTKGVERDATVQQGSCLSPGSLPVL